jgi:hypothetical protein
MTLTACHLSISVDGFVAGPNQDLDNPAQGHPHPLPPTPLTGNVPAISTIRTVGCC